MDKKLETVTYLQFRNGVKEQVTIDKLVTGQLSPKAKAVPSFLSYFNIADQQSSALPTKLIMPGSLCIVGTRPCRKSSVRVAWRQNLRLRGRSTTTTIRRNCTQGSNAGRETWF